MRDILLNELTVPVFEHAIKNMKLIQMIYYFVIKKAMSLLIAH